MTSSPADQALSLNDLMATLHGLVEDTFPAALWVRCEVVSAQQKPKGYWVLQVQDSEAGREANAQIMVWRNAVPRVIGHFIKVMGQPLKAGMQILLQVRVGFSPQWGLSLTAEAIDPAFTLGQAHMETERIRAAIKHQGIWEANRKLPAPLSFCRVALVAPGGSAGLGDVQVETHALEQAGLCEFDVHLASFEGKNAVRELVETLERFTDDQAYDAVCLVRGGGGTAGIQTLDHQAIVEAVCRCPIPVIVGIGHERDHTLLDEVAFLSLGTPSKAIGHITHALIQQAQASQEAWLAVEQTVRQRLEEAHNRARALQEEAWRRATQGLATAEQGLASLRQEIRHRSERLVELANQSTEALVREAVGLGPGATLARGYAWVSGPEGPITQAAQARQAPHLILHFADGDMGTQPEVTP
jgi:exodeoxyribonuclease VII large subunit